MKRVRFINEWKGFTEFGFFQVMYARVEVVAGKIAILDLTVAPGMLGTLYISVVVLGFGFSILVGTPRNKRYLA